ncbi:MAG: hypothetical protein HYY26_07200 [Acidobacteria bacterium]|nr:hypothetical protein [Acidobacteriota bacterium]
MPDWEEIVGQRLGRMKLAPEERREVIAEVAAHLEECYQELCAAGSPDPEGYTLAQVPDWKALGRKIQRSKEGAMNQTIRIVLCGMATGMIMMLIGLVVLVHALPQTDLAIAVETARAAGRVVESPWRVPLHAFLTFAGGIWTMWLYASIRPRYGPGPKTAAIAGFALWVISALRDISWVSIGLMPFGLSSLMAPVPVGLPIAIVAAVAGAWAFEASERKPLQALRAA